MSKYQEVVEDIIRKIEKNEYTDKLPTEDQLIEQYQVSRNTIRNGIRTLRNKVPYSLFREVVYLYVIQEMMILYG